jgi:hypothetical protein
MCCFVTVSKHIRNIRAIAKQLVGKWVPAATDMHTAIKVLLGYSNGNGVFYVVHAKML